MAQSKLPWCHSWRRPNSKINRKTMRPTVDWMLKFKNGVGISKTISMSNTKNKTAKRKNRVENGIRAFEKGSKPHS